jgi:resolvase-like protein
MSMKIVGSTGDSSAHGKNIVGVTGDSPLVLDIYGRVSRLTDKRMRSISGQVKDCRFRVREYGGEVGEELADPGRSAWDPKVERPGWDRLMGRLESGASQGVCIFDASRFSRQPIEGERLIQLAQRGLVVLDSEREFDLTSADGKLAFRDQMRTAAYYSDRLSTVSKRGKRIKAMEGEPVNPHRAFGFEPDGVTLRMAEVEIMRDRVRKLLGYDDEPRWTLEDVAEDLNARGVLTALAPCSKHNGTERRPCSWCGRRKAAGRGDGTWQGNTFKEMLLKPRNAGLIMLNGEVMGRLPGEPIFDEAMWADLNAFFAARRRGRPPSQMYVCTRIAVCGLCGHHLSGRPRWNVAPYSDGEPRRQYFCHPGGEGRPGGCARISVDQRALDLHVKTLVATFLSSPKHAEQIEAAAAARRSLDDQRSTLEDKIADLEHTATELAARLGRGEISLTRHDAAAAPLDKRLAKLRSDLEELTEQLKSTPKVGAQQVKASREVWEKRWDAATTEEKRTLLRRALISRELVVGPVVKPGPFNSDRVTVRPIRRKKG